MWKIGHNLNMGLGGWRAMRRAIVDSIFVFYFLLIFVRHVPQAVSYNNYQLLQHRMFITRLHFPNFISRSPCEAQVVILFILHTRELKLRELNLFTEKHTDKNQGPKPRLLAPNQIFFPYIMFSCNYFFYLTLSLLKINS